MAFQIDVVKAPKSGAKRRLPLGYDAASANRVLKDRDQAFFARAFDLAFFIHANKEIAFFIAEDALEALTSLLGYQKKNRRPSEGLRGFWKWGERTRPIRRRLLLNESQMLQWLVFKHSEYWERQTEQSVGLYVPTEEDLVIRYVETLVFLSVRRSSFYVTLAIGSLLHRFDRRETRLFYDILTQSDSARMKDTNYISKQRLELLDKVFQRFDGITSPRARVPRASRLALPPPLFARWRLSNRIGLKPEQWPYGKGTISHHEFLRVTRNFSHFSLSRFV